MPRSPLQSLLRALIVPFGASLVPLGLLVGAAVLGGCASGEKRDGLARVDDLLTKVEQVQIESLAAREKASLAFDAYGVIVAPDFRGDPMVAFNELVTRIHDSQAQAQKLQDVLAPMQELADGVFRAWTADLEKFGNSNLRQSSQSRLAETRARYSAVHDAATAALVSMNAFNSDLNDQALFLEHDFNAAAVTVIASEVPALSNQARDLGRRLNECVAASKRYVTSSSLRGQLDAPAEAPVQEVAAAPQAAPARKLPNPMLEDEAVEPAASETPAPTMVAPAKRRPRGEGAAQAAPGAPVSPGAQVAPGAPQPSTVPTAQPNAQQAGQPNAQPLDTLPPAKPKPDSDLPAGGGN